MNFPTMTYRADVTNNPNDPAQPASVWTDLTSRVFVAADGSGGGWRAQRGRSYSGGHADSGSLDIWLDNRDNALTAARLMAKLQILAGYGSNLLDRSTALLTEDTLDWTAGANTTVTHDLTRGFGAPGCLALTAVAGGSVSATMTTAVPVASGTAYVAWLAALAVTTPRAVSMTVAWFTAVGAANGTSAAGSANDATGQWTQFGGVSATAPALTATAKLTVTIAGLALGETHCVDLAGLFPAAGFTAWTPPAAESPFTVFTGYVQKWSRLRDLDGVFPYVQPVVVDALNPLAGVDLLAAYDSEVLIDAPLAYYPCAEPAGATAVGNISAYGLPNALLTTSKYGGGIVTGDTSAPQAMAWEDNPPAVLAVTSPGSGQAGAFAGGCVQMPASVAAVSPAGVTFEMIARVDSSYTGGTVAKMLRLVYFGLDLVLLSCNSANPQTFLQTGSGPAGGGSAFATTPVNIIDDKWHHYACVIAADAQTVTLYIDGAQAAQAVAASPIAWPAGALLGFGGSPWSNNPGSGFNGKVGRCAVYQSALSAARIASHASVFATGASGETSDARLARILNYLPWYGGRALTAGASVEGAVLGLDGKNAVAALQDVGDIDESGIVFADSAGNIAFRGRHYAQGFVLPRFVFGNLDANGEIPYQGDIEDATDLEQTFNLAPVTQQGGVQVVGQNLASQQKYFPRSTGDVTVNVASTDEVADRANWATSAHAYGEPLPHVVNLRFKPSNLRPSTVPLAWYAALSLEVGDPVRVMIRDIGQPTRQLDLVVDEIIPTVGQTPGEWDVQLSLSPLVKAWTVSGLRMTVNTQALAGATTVVVNPLADAATNPAETVLIPGMLLTFQNPGAIDIVGVLTVTSSIPGLTGYTQVTLGITRVIGGGGPLAAAVGVNNTSTNDTLTLTAPSLAATRFVICEGEVMAVIAGAGTATLTVTRGPNGNGTSQQPHAAGTPVTFLSNAGLINTHNAGVLISEQLSTTPDGRTVGNPARWDTNSVIGVLTTTVKSGGAAGTNTVVLHALPDWPLNQPGCNLYQAMQLRLSPGTGNDETLTIDTVSAPAADGSFTVTFTANLAHTHAAADTVCEPLPSGVNTPSAVAVTTLVGY